jgi:hypothetical protein
VYIIGSQLLFGIRYMWLFLMPPCTLITYSRHII